MITHILDTNVVSRYLSNRKHFVELLEESIGLEKVCISVVTKIELLNWLSNYKAINVQQRNVFKKGILLLPVKHINLEISKKANDYIETDVNSKVADTLIGCTANYYNLFLVTTNAKDFKKFELLTISVKD